VKRLSLVLSSLVFACSGSSPSAVAPSPPANRGPLLVATDPTPPSTPPAPTAPPARLFTPRQHPPHLAARSQPVDLKRLPQLRTTECFARPRVVISQSGQIINLSGTGGGLAGIGSTGRGGGSGSGATTPKAAAKKPSASRSPAADASESQGYGYSFQDSARAPAAAAPPPSPRPAPTSAPNKAPSAPPLHAEVAKGEAAVVDPAVTASEVAAAEAPSGYHDFGASIYLSNDDTMSLSSAQRVMFAIDGFLPIPREHIRPHELLNYFSFETAPIRRPRTSASKPRSNRSLGNRRNSRLACR